MKFVQPDKVRQPQGGLILTEPAPTDYILGSKDPKNIGVGISDGHWAKAAERVPIEIQRVADGNTFGCTVFADNTIDEILSVYQYNEEVDISDRLVNKMSGTIRGQGNSMKASAEWKRKNGWVWEKEWPYNRQMTLDEFYADIPQEILDKAKMMLNIYETGYLDVPGTNNATTIKALTVSPIKIAIEGFYLFDSDGRLRNSTTGYNHAVVLIDFKAINGKVEEYWVYDSETDQFLKMRGDYIFKAPIVKTLKKKPMPKLYKKKGEPAIYALDPETSTLVPFMSGVVAGGRFFKTAYGVNSYTEMPRVTDAQGEDWDELPFPKADWGMCSQSFNPLI